MSIIKNGCICGGDYYTVTEQCDNPDCNSERKKEKIENKWEKIAECIGSWFVENDNLSVEEYDKILKDIGVENA